MEHARLGSSGLKVSRVCLARMSDGSPTRRERVLGVDAAGGDEAPHPPHPVLGHT